MQYNKRIKFISENYISVIFSQGLEIKWIRQVGGKIEYLFLSFQTQDKRDKLYEDLLKQSVVSLETVPQNQMLLRWRNGYLSNYDYILYINR